MSRVRSLKVRKSESPNDSLKPEVESPKSEEENNSPPPISGPHSEINKRRSSLEHVEKINNSEKSEIANKSEIEHPNSEIKTMEVHHHPEVEKKGLREYILEGLMIFLAVMMGFFAERLREHITENNRANEYAVTLYSDLKLDTAELDGYIDYFQHAKANVDTLMQLLDNADPRQVQSGKLYWFGLWGGAYHIFTPHDATLDEMKSSGSLRFFGNRLITRKLALYDVLCRSIEAADEKEAGIYTEVRKARAKLFEFRYNDEANNIYHGFASNPYGKKVASRQALIDSFKKTNPPLLSYDKVLFNEYIEMVRSRFFYLKVQSADTLRRRATELIGLLNKEYHLTDE
jgi:hypothetical protein